EREDVRVPVDTHRVGIGRGERVVPGAGGELYHSRAYRVAHDGAGETAPAVVEDAHDVPAADPAPGGVGRVDAERLPSLHLGGLAERPDVELAVESRRRVVRDEVERIARRQRRAEPLGGLEPGRVTR